MAFGSKFPIKNKITRYSEFFILLFELFVKENMKIKHVRKEIVFQGFKTHITLLFPLKLFYHSEKRPKQTGIPVSIYSVYPKEYFSNCKASLFRQR